MKEYLKNFYVWYKAYLLFPQESTLGEVIMGTIYGLIVGFVVIGTGIGLILSLLGII